MRIPPARTALLLLLALALPALLGACAADGAVAPPSAAGAGRSPWGDFGEEVVRIERPDSILELCVLLAVTAAQHSEGLMNAPDAGLGGYDGMLFSFEDDTTGGFWMRDTEVPLTIAWFAEDGSLVSTLDMEPCGEGEESCPSYRPSGPYRLALEVPQGDLAEAGVAADARLVRTGQSCPAPS